MCKAWLLAGLVLLGAGCKRGADSAAGSDPETAVAPLLSREQTRDVDFVYFAGEGAEARGGTSPARVILKPNPSSEVRVAVYEEFSGGAGSQWRASVWMASFLSSGLVGRQLTDYEFGVSTGGLVDGPSAGALTTAAMLAALNGAPVRPEVTMTGTVNPDGTVGPVGGIPQKVAGAAAAGKKEFGYPVGQRYDTDVATGRLVDLHAVAEQHGLVAREVRDVYDAYALLTGRTLARPAALPTHAMDVSPRVFQRMQAKTDAWLARAAANLARVRQQRSPVLASFGPLIEQTAEAHAQARRFQAQGMVPVAYGRALQAAAGTEMLLGFGKLGNMVLAGAALADIELELGALFSVEAELAAFRTRLRTEAPATTTAAVSQVEAYACAVDTWASLALARRELSGLREAGTRQVLEKLLVANIYLATARLTLEAGEDMLELAGEDGAPFRADADALERLARGYTSAAKANLDYYDALVTDAQAGAAGVSAAAMRAQKMARNYEYQMVRMRLGYALEHRHEKGVPAALANVAAALASYLESAELVTAEYSLGVEQRPGGGKEVGRDKALMAMLELGELRAREGAALAARVSGGVPGRAQAQYQSGRALREGDVEDKLRALSFYWASSLSSQLAVQFTRLPAPRALAAQGAP
jgi:predicted S18 family serine protease